MQETSTWILSELSHLDPTTQLLTCLLNGTVAREFIDAFIALYTYIDLLPAQVDTNVPTL
jgi:hypothetical protein